MILPGKDTPTDMADLDQLLDERGIKHQLRRYPLAESENVKHVIRYNPAGDWQVVIHYDGDEYSVIRGAASFGRYEIYSLKGKGKKFVVDPERFDTPTDLVAALTGAEA